MMYRNGTSHVPNRTTKNTCTEIDLICTEVVMYRNCPPLCTETVMYRKRPNPYPSTLTDLDETWSQGPYSDLPVRQYGRCMFTGRCGRCCRCGRYVVYTDPKRDLWKKVKLSNIINNDIDVRYRLIMTYSKIYYVYNPQQTCSQSHTKHNKTTTYDHVSTLCQVVSSQTDCQSASWLSLLLICWRGSAKRWRWALALGSYS